MNLILNKYSEFAQAEYGCNITTGQLDDITRTFDIITMFHVLEHLPSPIKAFKKLYKSLNNNGILFIEVPWLEANDASPHNIYFKAHIFYFTADTLAACASQYFEVVKIDTSSNLKILLRAKAKPSAIVLPSPESIARLRKRLARKGWLEYPTYGKGLSKPIDKISRIIKESNVKHMQPKEILDMLLNNKQ